MELVFRAVEFPADRGRAERFLLASSWPFHSVHRLGPDSAAAIELVSASTASFWAMLGDEPVALIRLLELDDIDDGGGGSPVFDLRVAERHRGAGIGRQCVVWLTGHLFETHPALRRVEAHTRSDNVAMQTVLDRCGYTREGRFREAWPTADGEWLDGLAYGILRREWTSTPR